MMKASQNRDQISAEQFDELFENGDVTPYLDRVTLKVHRQVQRINLDIPSDILIQIDQEAGRIGVARTALIKVWLVERLAYDQRRLVTKAN